jgi:large subunit ribosomal protein L15
MKIHDLKPQDGSKKSRKRVGRGIAAGQGKTAGRGTKGQGARSGGQTRLYHQGGNLPFFRRLPFMRGKGFTPINRVEYSEVNVDQLAKKFEANSEITPEVLFESRLVRKRRRPVVVLGRGEVDVPLKVRVHRISDSARAKIEAAGGSVEIIE